MKSNRSTRVASLLLSALAASVLITKSASAEIRWEATPANALASARETDRLIVVYVTTEWCHFCKIMDQETWADERVDQLVNQQFKTLALDGDRDREIVEKIGISGYPATMLYTSDGNYITHRSGYMSPGEVIAWLTVDWRSVQRQLHDSDQ